MSKSSRVVLEMGSLKFRCEGDPEWVGKQLDKVLGHLHRGSSASLAPSGHRTPAIVVTHADVVRYECDILILKYAQNFFGADLAVAQLLKEHCSATGFDGENFTLRPGQYRVFPGGGAVAAKCILFIGVCPLIDFGYEQIHTFAVQAMQVAVQAAIPGATIAMTIHGVGYGLDEGAAFDAQLAGLRAGLSAPAVQNTIGKIIIVERDSERVLRLQRQLDGVSQDSTRR